MKLEEKLKEFEESCLNLASKESEKLKDEISKELEEQMKAELDEYKARKDWNFEKSVEKIEKDYMKNIFYYQTACKKDILKARENLEIDLKQCVIKKLEEYTENDDYKNYLLKSIEFVISNANNIDNFSIGITSKDFGKFGEIIKEKNNVEIFEIDNSYIGGCVLKSNSVYIDNTMLNSLEEKLKEEKD